MRTPEHLIVGRFEFRGFFGRPALCRLEVIPLGDGRTAVIATELADNPGTSVTNAAEHLASHVCDRFGVDPDRLVWIEHYGYPSAVNPREPRTFDLVTFTRRPPEKIQWSATVLGSHPDGWPGYFDDPEWRSMAEADWTALGLSCRHPSVSP